ncbi:MAG TPA: TetR/AcrR family transcriptional regulator [Rhodococcus sp. (in: high G+C Gram-positive bacteria)]|nr:TetR/AcrR family transcriptional regulator [Rhodococcus sp. (in: high G+C Gram-positive bacteria)]
MTSAPGLRDRKKAATRAALAEAAAELAREHGLHEVTADAIAARAGVSTRTFHNYFTSKEEAVLVHFEGLIETWIDLLRHRPAGEPIMVSLEECAVGLLTDPQWSFDDIGTCVAFVEEGSANESRHIDVAMRSSQLLVEVIAERTATDPVTDIYPNLVHYASLGAIKAAIEMCLPDSGSPNSGSSPEHLIREAFAQLRRGFS